MRKFSIIITTCLFLLGCVSFQSKDVYLIERTADKLYFHLTLPTGERFLNPHGLVWSREIEWYSIELERQDLDFSTKTFVIQAQQAPVDIIKGKIELKYLEGSCVLIIDIVPKNDKDIVLNGSHTVARCSKT